MEKNPDSLPNVSIIIPVFNGLSYTQDCLKSLDQHTGVDCEIIVVDNASTDGTADYLRASGFANKKIRDFRVITNQSNLGFSKACNQGYRQTKGQYIVFLNNDTIVTPQWLEPLLACFLAYERVGIVTPKLLYPESGKIQYAGVSLLPNGLPHLLFYNEEGDTPAANVRREVPIACGGCIVFPRAVLQEVGLFDEWFINGMEDVDLSLRVKKADYKTIYCPQSVIYHYESVTEGRSKYNTENIRYYLDKWKSQISAGKNGEVYFLKSGAKHPREREEEDRDAAGHSHATGRIYQAYWRSGF